LTAEVENALSAIALKAFSVSRRNKKMLQIFSHNFNFDFKSVREVNRNGKSYIVVPGVPVVEGVLNQYYVPFDEFSMYPFDWNDVPVVLNHPSQNSGAARVTYPDVPVVGRFYNASIDEQGRRLVGEFWLEKDVLIANEDGAKMYDLILRGQPLEVSTGYYAPGVVFESGKFKGTDYIGIHKNIHPDHIAILTKDRGACSLMDGCGVNRNSEFVVQNCGNCSACPSKAISKNEAEDKPGGAEKSMIALMIPDVLRADLQKAYPLMDDKTRDGLHITIVYLGDSRTLDTEQVVKALLSSAGSTSGIKGKMTGLARFVGEGDSDVVVALFDSPEMQSLYNRVRSELDDRRVPYHSAHSFVPHMTIGYVKKGEPMPIESIEPMEINFSEVSLVVDDDVVIPATLDGYKGVAMNSQRLNIQFNRQFANPARAWFADIATHFTKEYLMKNFPALQTFLNSLGFNVKTASEDGDSVSLVLTGDGDGKTLEGLVQLNEVVRNAGGVVAFTQTLETLSKLPDAVAGMQAQLNTIVQNAASQQDVAKKAAIQKVMQNSANPFDEATLNQMSLDVLEKLAASFVPVNYAAFGAGYVHNSSADDKPLATPNMLALFSANGKEA
jgi:2'-5' RNA ligase